MGPDEGGALRRGERSLFVQGALRDSRRWFEAAYTEAESAGRTEEMARAALGLGGLWVHEHRTAAEAAGVESRQWRALALLEPASLLALRLRARLAGEADYRSGRHTRVLAVVEEARRAGDATALAEVLSLAHHCLLGPGHGAKRLELADELLRVGSGTGRRSDVLMGLLWQTTDRFLVADPRAERSLAELRDALDHQDHLAAGFVASAFQVMLAIRAGRFTDAERLAAVCAERGALAGDADAEGWYGAHLVAIRWYQGRGAELVPALAELAHSPTLSPVDHAYFAALAICAATAGDRRQARGALARLRGRTLCDLVPSSSWLVAMYGAVEAAHLLDDRQTAAEAYALLRPFAELPMMCSLAVACFGSTHHALGVAALTSGELDRAVGHFRDAVRANHALGHWPAAALSQHRLGQALARRQGAGDRAQAAAELAAAAAEATGLGMSLPPVEGAGAWGEPPVPVPVCRRRGPRWQVEIGLRTVLVKDSVGMRYLAKLIGNPGQDIPAIDLAGAAPEPSEQPARVGDSRQPLLDDVAVREYRKRLTELQTEADEYLAMNDLERVAAAHVERDWLLGELEAATGLSGRRRHFADDAERARIAVGKAIRRALDRLAAADPVIGDELRARTQTGLRCCFHAD
ncbi:MULTISPECIES: hypothetical protein [Streptomyces]|uniref:LuxR family transcriptional regulator n=2 Tax=Streptomyces TaxID=1883 RepID=A0ABV9J2P4_9ACTN